MYNSDDNTMIPILFVTQRLSNWMLLTIVNSPHKSWSLTVYEVWCLCDLKRYFRKRDLKKSCFIYHTINIAIINALTIFYIFVSQENKNVFFFCYIIIYNGFNIIWSLQRVKRNDLHLDLLKNVVPKFWLYRYWAICVHTFILGPRGENFTSF